MPVYGYYRCSTTQQDEERQIRALKNAKCDFITGDKITGTSDFNSRPALSKLLDEMESGSTLIISELSRLSRSFIGMVNEVSNLLERGIQIVTLDNRLNTTKMPKEITMLIVSILGYAASEELKAIKSRTEEGRQVAKSRGVKFGRKRVYDQFQIQQILKMRDQGDGYGTIARSLGMSRGTVQKIVNREKNAVVGIQ